MPKIVRRRLVLEVVLFGAFGLALKAFGLVARAVGLALLPALENPDLEIGLALEEGNRPIAEFENAVDLRFGERLAERDCDVVIVGGHRRTRPDFSAGVKPIAQRARVLSGCTAEIAVLTSSRDGTMGHARRK